MCDLFLEQMRAAMLLQPRALPRTLVFTAGEGARGMATIAWRARAMEWKRKLVPLKWQERADIDHAIDCFQPHLYPPDMITYAVGHQRLGQRTSMTWVTRTAASSWAGTAK